MAKNDNMLAILWMMNTGSKITAKQISEKLEMNIRTVYRYIDALCASGVPIISDPGHNGGYSLLNDFIKAPLLLDMEEKKALLQAAVFAKEAGHPSSDALETVTSKLRKYSNQAQESMLNHHLAGLEVINREVDTSVQSRLAELEQAVNGESSIEIDYRTGRDQQTKNRIIDPYGLVYWNYKWYTVGFCHLRKEIRSFRVDRILSINGTESVFLRPEGFSTREFFIKNLLPAASDRKDLIPLIVEGRAETLDDLCMHWYLGHHLKERTSDQATFLLEGTAIHLYVPYFLLSYGKSIRIIEPQSLKERLIAIASELIEYYQI